MNILRSKAETAYHPCGTLKMGVDKMAVVDENLKIYGLQNIRVIDASVMPEIPSANLNAPTLMIAEKASDIISKHKLIRCIFSWKKNRAKERFFFK